MPTYTLLDGTTAAVDFTSKLSTGGTQQSFKCIANYIMLMFRRPTTQKFTFCSSGWAVPTPGVRQGFGHIDGFMSTGGPVSDPLALFTQDTALDFVFTAHTGCTLSGALLETQDQSSSRALAESGRGIDFETSGVVASTWVVA